MGVYFFIPLLWMTGSQYFFILFYEAAVFNMLYLCVCVTVCVVVNVVGCCVSGGVLSFF